MKAFLSARIKGLLPAFRYGPVWYKVPRITGSK